MSPIGRWLARLRIPSSSKEPLLEARTPENSGARSEPRVDRHLRDATAALTRGALVEAEAAFLEALHVNHECSEAHYGLGRLRVRQKRFEDAADELHLAVLYDPEFAAAHAELALALAHQGSRAAAQEAAAEALNRAGDSIAVWSTCARTFKALGEFDRAAECLARALLLKPDDEEIACQLGFARYLHGDYDSAREAYMAVLERNPNHVPSVHNLGLLELELGHSDQALRHFEHAAALSPGVETMACIGHALRDAGNLAAACAKYEQVLAIDPEFGDARINLGYALLMRGDYEGGWAHYESRFEATGAPARDFGLPTWNGESLAGRRLLVFAEQGIGDEIMFASCLPQVIEVAKQCVVECNTRLADLFARSFPAATVHGGEKNDDPGWITNLPRCDYQIAVGSLPRHFRTTAGSFTPGAAYLVPDHHRVAQWRRRLHGDSRICVGISWRGGTLRSRQWQRSVPLDLWAGLFALPGCSFVALQYGDCAREIEQVRAASGVEIDDLGGVCKDIDELAAVVRALDLVITVPNTLAHVAGAVGQKVWVLLPPIPEWRYPRAGKQMPWYGSMRLYRRTPSTDSADVLLQVCTDLRAECQAYSVRN